MRTWATMPKEKRRRHLIARSIVSSMYFSIYILCAGIWLFQQSSTHCDRVLQIPFIVLGVFIAVVSISIFCCLPGEDGVAVYHVSMFLLILGLFILTIFTFAVTSKGGGEALPGKEYKEYRLGDYSKWLRKSVDNTKNWNNNIRSCLKDHSKVCQSLIDDGAYNSTTVDVFYTEPLSSLQSGCCKPSNDCNFTYGSPTNWTITGGSYNNSDCSLWSNDQNILCFGCHSCKAGLLDNVNHMLKKMAVAMIIFLVLLSILYGIGFYLWNDGKW